MSVAAEKEQTERLLANVEAIEEVAGMLPSGAPGRFPSRGALIRRRASRPRDFQRWRRCKLPAMPSRFPSG